MYNLNIEYIEKNLFEVIHALKEYDGTIPFQLDITYGELSDLGHALFFYKKDVMIAHKYEYWALPGESLDDCNNRLIKQLLDATGLPIYIKGSDKSQLDKGIISLDSFFIQDHMEELIALEDYVPLSFMTYGFQKERDEFLKSKNLLKIIHDMDKLILEKCEYSDDPGHAWNSVLVEWLDCHLEFEGIIATESFVDYQNMKNNKEYIDFIDLCYTPKKWTPPTENKQIGRRDDSSIQLPNFKKINEIYDKFDVSLLTYYLAYLV